MNSQKNLGGPVTFKDMDDRDFPGCPVVKVLSFQCRRCSLSPSKGIKISYTEWCSQNKR